MHIYVQIISTPAGKMQLAATSKAIVALCFGNAMSDILAKIARDAKVDLRIERQSNPLTRMAAAQLAEYFSGTRETFTVPLKLYGTRFQKDAWQALRKIPYGQTISYGKQAAIAGHAKAVRAIGGANGRNPICIIIPCHRVIAGDGSLGGFTGGLPIKRRLLAVEN